MNTGFGGSADVRTSKILNLQKSLVQFLNAGVLHPSDKGLSRGKLRDLKSHALPANVVKATILIRCNSLLRGHSGVRTEIIDALLNLLKHDLTPIIPLRGSISASGDLIPLSYIVGAILGNPDIYVDCGAALNYQVVSSDVALRIAGLSPVILGPKEGLGLLNGTATSAAMASFAMYHSQQLAVLTQIITAMSTEALRGHASSFDPFIAETRPHPGQTEVARNVLDFLSGSHLCIWKEGSATCGLAQDRYAIRTASQWIGPPLEDLQLAERQVTVELNSTTDNPLIDVRDGSVHNGGNFQAASITSAMEKTRMALQMLGKLVFAQSQELINPAYSNGLPPNLVFDEPSLSFTFKGADITMAAYMSELAFLANPVGSHVQSAEMHNQALNSLALISARYTMDAVEILSLMCATHICELLQALDLRVLSLEFEKRIKPAFEAATKQVFETIDDAGLTFLWTKLTNEWTSRTTLDLADRSAATATATLPVLLSLLPPTTPLTLLNTWQTLLTTTLSTTYTATKSAFNVDPAAITIPYLGKASRAVYLFVRGTLGVGLHRGFEEDFGNWENGRRGGRRGVVGTVGSRTGIVYEKLREGAFVGEVLVGMKR